MLVGRAAVGVTTEVVDLAELGGNRAAGMCAAVGDELRRFPSGAGEQPPPAAEIDDDARRVDHGPPDLAAEHRAERVVFGDRDAGRGLAPCRQHVIGVFGDQPVDRRREHVAVGDEAVIGE